MRGRGLVVALALSLAAASFGGPVAAAPLSAVAAEAAGFSDVPEGHVFAVEVGWLASTGITVGRDDGSFGLNDVVTRGAMAALLYRYEGEPDGPFDSPDFPDVPAGHAFEEGIAWLASTGITRGRDDGTFGLSEPVTRGAMAAFLYRYDGQPDGPFDAPSFGDIPAGHAFETEIAWLASTGVTQGRGDGTFGLNDPVTRGAMAAFLFRYATVLQLTYDVAAGTTVTLPLAGREDPSSDAGIDAIIHWGDGTRSAVDTADIYSHTYRDAGRYTVVIVGVFTRFATGHSSSGREGMDRLISVDSWSEPLEYVAFEGAVNLTTVPEDLPSTVRNVRGMFAGAEVFDQDISAWDTSNLTDMGRMFDGASSFNQSIADWDTSNVLSMRSMFRAAEAFNQPIGGWDTSNVTDMGHMFDGASSFNQPIGGWDVANVTDMAMMFSEASSFDQDLFGWNGDNGEIRSPFAPTGAISFLPGTRHQDLGFFAAPDIYRTFAAAPDEASLVVDDGVVTSVLYDGNREQLLVRRHAPGSLTTVGDPLAISTAGWPRWGGHLAAPDGSHFVLLGRDNLDERPAYDTIEVRRYDADWNVLSTGRFSNDSRGVYEPFAFGSPSMALVGGQLVIHMSRIQFITPDTLRHQVNLTLIGDADSLTMRSYEGRPYASHSFNQLLVASDDGQDLIFVDHGDAFPRGIQSGVTSVAGAQEGARAPTSLVFTFDGSRADDRYQWTGTSVTGLGALDDGAIVVGNSVEHSGASSRTVDDTESRNVFVLTMDDAGVRRDMRWLTDFPAHGGRTAGDPRLVRLDDGRFVILFTVFDADGGTSLNYRLLDGSGRQSASATWPDALLGAVSDVIVDGSNLYWLRSHDPLYQPMFFLRLDITDPSSPVLQP